MQTRVLSYRALFGLVGGLILVFATASYPQEPTKEADATATRADVMHVKALELQSTPATIVDAARMHADEAALRHPFDVSATDCLTLAGNLFYVAKRPLDAKRIMEQAADRALSLGDIHRSAILYLNASIAARDGGARDEMTRLGQKADMLTSSPLLSKAQRDEIHRRFTHPTEAGKTERARLALRADSLHSEALRLQQEPGRALEAARLYKDEAKLRMRDDPSAVDNLLLASQLMYISNRPLEARRTLEEAGDRALGAGDVPRAALAFIEAAFIADKEGNKAETQRLGHRAEMLSVSELLTDQQRQEIMRRIRRVPMA